MPPGSDLRIQVKLQNEGFASPLLKRPVYLLLMSEDVALRYATGADPRRWEPGQHTLTAMLSLPNDLPRGEYALFLWLPDQDERLRADPRYAIRLANENVWDAAHGWNLLGTLYVDP